VKSARKPFVAPKLKEEASLADVTLISGGNPTRNCKKGSFKSLKHLRRRRARGGGGRIGGLGVGDGVSELARRLLNHGVGKA
jgi:hypothetical protein